MGDSKAFLTVKRKEGGYRPLHERIDDYSEVEQTLNTEDRKLQLSRCMECGVPFCHWACPVGNIQPEWQDLAFKGNIKKAYQLLNTYNDFPEFTGRVCPALCEKACVLKLTFNAPVTIRENEAAVTEYAFEEGFVQPHKPVKEREGKVAVVGSGPSGLACANRLRRLGYQVTVFEQDEEAGGLMRFGIPDFKLNKKVVQRRIDLMKQEGVEFKTGVTVGRDITKEQLTRDFDAVCLAVGSRTPRDLSVEGRNLKGIYTALDFLQMQNRVNAGESPKEKISAKGKNVLVIGGGDTGSDCIGTANRHKAKAVTQIEIMPMPPEGQNPDTPWPMYPMVLKTTSSHEEGCRREWNLDTRRFLGDEKGCVKAVEVERVEWSKDENGRMQMRRTGETQVIEAELVLLAMGFVHPVHEGLLDALEVEYDNRGNVKTGTTGMSSVEKVFAAGDAATGASLVVRAMASGQQAAKHIHEYLEIKRNEK